MDDGQREILCLLQAGRLKLKLFMVPDPDKLD